MRWIGAPAPSLRLIVAGLPILRNLASSLTSRRPSRREKAAGAAAGSDPRGPAFQAQPYSPAGRTPMAIPQDALETLAPAPYAEVRKTLRDGDIVLCQGR